MNLCMVVIGLSFVACAAAANATSTANTTSTSTANTTSTSTANTTSTSAANTNTLNGKVGFSMARNNEQVPYCLPYPSTYLKEDFSERWEHGHKVFVRSSPDKASKVKPSRMDLQGTCGPRSLKELYEDDRKNIITETGTEKAMTMSVLRKDSYVLSWRTGDRIHYGKMWVAKNDPGCFVRAIFDYDVSEREAFDAIIPKVVAADPACPATP